MYGFPFWLVQPTSPHNLLHSQRRLSHSSSLASTYYLYFFLFPLLISFFDGVIPPHRRWKQICIESRCPIWPQNATSGLTSARITIKLLLKCTSQRYCPSWWTQPGRQQEFKISEFDQLSTKTKSRMALFLRDCILFFWCSGISLFFSISPQHISSWPQRENHSINMVKRF